VFLEIYATGGDFQGYFASPANEFLCIVNHLLRIINYPVQKEPVSKKRYFVTLLFICPVISLHFCLKQDGILYKVILLAGGSQRLIFFSGPK
jgi:hypothetical protein